MKLECIGNLLLLDYLGQWPPKTIVLSLKLIVKPKLEGNLVKYVLIFRENEILRFWIFCFVFREWNCDLCQFDVEEIAFAYKIQEAVDYIVQAYQGKYYNMIKIYSNTLLPINYNSSRPLIKAGPNSSRSKFVSFFNKSYTI